MNKALEINTVSVSIKVVSVDGKRLTKAVFNQIQEAWPFDERFFCIGDVLGYIVDGQWHLLWVLEGELRRYPLGGARRFVEAFSRGKDSGIGHQYIPANFSKTLGYKEDRFGRYSSQDLVDMGAKSVDLNAFLLTLTGQQLYIAI